MKAWQLTEREGYYVKVDREEEVEVTSFRSGVEWRGEEVCEIMVPAHLLS
eukprot:COSAG01_NODE_28124_length_668_cov_1.476274_1_plen_50_part_00